MTSNHTFVVCAYGESPFLEDCIKSLKEQTYPSRVILYTSTPNKLISRLADKYSLPIYSDIGGGIGKDWNNALSFVESQYATIAHQDDIYLPHYTEKVLSFFSKFPNSSIVFSDYDELRDNQRIKTNLNLKIKRMMLNTLRLAPTSGFWQQRILSFGNPISCPAVSYNLELLNGFKFDEEWRTSLDWLAWYTISKSYKGRFTYISETLMLHRIHEESETTATIADNIRSKEDFLMYQKLWPKPIAKLLIKVYENSQKSNQ